MSFNIAIFLVDFGTIYTLYLAVSLTLNLEAGFAGVPNFGKVMFVAGEPPSRALSADGCPP